MQKNYALVSHDSSTEVVVVWPFKLKQQQENN